MEDELPSWYHGKIGRAEAESILSTVLDTDGRFLIRNASHGNGYVLSAVQDRVITHFQIRTEHAGNRDFLTFDTETSQGPLFRTLAGVVHYLINTPNLLPNPLGDWIPCETNTTSRQDSSKRGGMTQNIDDALCDALAAQGAVYAEPIEYAAQNPSVLGRTPAFQVKRGSVAFFDSEDVIRIVQTEVDQSGNKIVVCENQHNRRAKIPFGSSDIQLVPFLVANKSRGSPSGPAPPLPRRGSTVQEKTGHVSQGYEQFLPVNQRALKTASKADEDIVYREVIMEGFLQKLPPAGNTFRGWKRRWFRLVVVISNTAMEKDGPLVLEYYDKPESPKPKGVINLGKAQKISRVDPADERAKKLSKVRPELLFKIVLQHRTYPLQAESPELVVQWLKVLNETLGLTETGDKVYVAKPVAKTGHFAYQFKCRALKGQNAEEGFPCTLLLQERKVIVTSDSSGQSMSWYYSDLQQYGYVKRILWIRATAESSYAGMSCFSTPDAEAIWTVIRDRLREGNDEEFNGFNSSGTSHIGWGSRVGARTTNLSKSTLTTRVIFGRTVGASELMSAGIAVVMTPYKAANQQQMDLKMGEIIPILSSKEFADEGFLLTEESENRFLLVKESCVQIHEHEFSSLNDEDDLLDGVEVSLMDPAAPAYEVPVLLALQKPQATEKSGPVTPAPSDPNRMYEYAPIGEMRDAAGYPNSSGDDAEYVNASMDYINAATIQHDMANADLATQGKRLSGDGKSDKVEYVNASVAGMRVTRKTGDPAGFVDVRDADVGYVNAAAMTAAAHQNPAIPGEMRSRSKDTNLTPNRLGRQGSNSDL